MSKLRPYQIAQDGASVGDVLVWNGSQWVPDAPSGGGGGGGGSAAIVAATVVPTATRTSGTSSSFASFPVGQVCSRAFTVTGDVVVTVTISGYTSDTHTMFEVAVQVDGTDHVVGPFTVNPSGTHQSYTVTRELTVATGTHTFTARIRRVSGSGSWLQDAGDVTCLTIAGAA
jgi:hypothetical protein